MNGIREAVQLKRYGGWRWVILRMYRVGRGGQCLDSAKEWRRKTLETIRARHFGLKWCRAAVMLGSLLGFRWASPSRVEGGAYLVAIPDSIQRAVNGLSFSFRLHRLAPHLQANVGRTAWASTYQYIKAAKTFHFHCPPFPSTQNL